MKQWISSGYDEFSKGKFGNGGQNIYVSKAGVLQRIHRTSVFGGKYVDLIYCNSQYHEELIPIAVYPDPINHPENKRELHIGGASDCAVADLSGEGREDMAWGCTWDGMTLLNLSAIYYNSDNGPSAKYVNYLPARGGRAVAAGDFNGDGRVDLIFISQDKLKLFTQDKVGFGAKMFIFLESPDAQCLAAYHFKGDKTATLFIRKTDGSVWMRKEFTPEAPEMQVLPPDPSYVKKEHSWDSYTQAVRDSTPKLRVIHIDGKDYLTVFRQKCLQLYLFEEKGLGESPLQIDCEAGSAAEAGDVFARGYSDLLVSCRAGNGIHETSYLYLGGPDGFSNSRRLEIPTYRASDVAMGNFSGGNGLDLVICQSHNTVSYDSDVLVFPTGTLTEPAIPAKPVRIPASDPTRVVVVHDKAGRPYLVIGNHHSGSFIGNPDNDIYFGSATGYHPHDKMTLPGWGSVDMVCTDINDDGKTDIVFANASELAPWLDKGSYIYLQKDGKFSRQPLSLRTNRAHGVVTGDFNHDGYLDLAFGGFDNPLLKIYYGGPDGYSEENCKVIKMEDEDGNVFQDPRFLSVADLNNDGYLELIISGNSGEVSYVLWGGPDGFDFHNRQEFKVHNGCCSRVADLDGDGWPELIWGAHSPTAGLPHDAYVCIYWGGPNGFSESRRTMLPCNAVNSMNVADFNNDGLLDIFVGSYQNAHDRDLPSFIYWNSPSGFYPNNRSMLDTHAVSGSIAADFTGSGYIDLAVANHKVNGNHIAYSTVWYNGKNGFDANNVVNLPTSGPHGMGSTDIGNVMDRSFDEYYESVPHAIPEGCGVYGIHWDAEIPEECDVFAQMKVADSVEALAESPWMGPLNDHGRFRANDHIDKNLFAGKYMQYRLILYAHNGVNTPRVKAVIVDFDEI